MPESNTPQIQPIYDDATCPLPGYEAVTFKVLLNPTQGVWRDWDEGRFNGDDAHRERYGRALCAFFGQSDVPGYDFSTPEAALKTIESDEAGYDIVYWLLGLPDTIMEHRRNLIAERLPKSWASASATLST